MVGAGRVAIVTAKGLGRARHCAGTGRNRAGLYWESVSARGRYLCGNCGRLQPEPKCGHCGWEPGRPVRVARPVQGQPRAES